VVNQSAIFEGAFLELADTVRAQVCEVLAQLPGNFPNIECRVFATADWQHEEIPTSSISQ
jgi:hypothetical protein